MIIEDQDEPLLQITGTTTTTTTPNTQKGGFRTLPSIIANEAFERVSSHGLSPNMIFYLMDEYHLSMAAGTNILYFRTAAINFMPVVGAFLADMSLGRFRSIGFGSVVCLLGMILLWSTAVFPQARPPPCNADDSTASCIQPATSQIILLCFSFVLMSIGTGGIRGSSLAFGADQLKRQKDRKYEGLMESYFGWYYAATAVAIIFAFTFLVYIQEQLGWKVGFGVPAICLFLSAISFFLASPFYVKLNAKSSLVIELVQVISALYKNRHFTSHQRPQVPCTSTKVQLWWFLQRNLACIIKDPQQDVAPDGRASDPWSLCTVDQVEDLKATLKIIPIWLAAILLSINSSQVSFPPLQTKSMDRHVTSSFEIPVGSFALFNVAGALLWVVLYDRVILPVALRITGRRVRFSPLQRMGCGILFSSSSMVLTAIVECVRRGIATKEGHTNDPQAIVSMSAMWLIPQKCLCGFSEALYLVAQNEFYVSELPKSMSSIATSVGALAAGAGSVLAGVIMNLVDQVTRGDGKVSWVSGNINEAHFDYYYCLLACLSFINLMYFQVCIRAFSHCHDEEGVILKESDAVEDN